MWISNRRYVYGVCGIRLHPTGVFSNVLMQNKRHENRKTSDWSKSYFSVHGSTDSDILGLGLGFNNFVINYVTSSVMAASYYIRVACFRMC